MHTRLAIGRALGTDEIDRSRLRLSYAFVVVIRRPPFPEGSVVHPAGIGDVVHAPPIAATHIVSELSMGDPFSLSRTCCVQGPPLPGNGSQLSYC